MAQRIPARLTAREGRRFAFTVGVAFLVLGALSLWRGHFLAPRVLGIVGAALVLAGVLVPARLGPVYRVWMGLARGISKVTTPIALGLVYYVVLSPIGVLMRLFGRNPLRHREREGGFWMAASSGGRSNLEMQF